MCYYKAILSVVFDCFADGQDPKWTRKEIEVGVGSNLILRCHSTIEPTFVKKPNQELKSGTKYWIKKNSLRKIYKLIITKIRHEDHGTYSCKAGGKRDDLVVKIRCESTVCSLFVFSAVSKTLAKL